jgi:hypothetical protein
VARRLAAQGVVLPGNAPGGAVTLGVNETWGRTTGADLARAFEGALG